MYGPQQHKQIPPYYSLLVVRECERPDAAVAGGVGVEEGEAEGAPHLHHAALPARDQVLAVARQKHALRRGGMKLELSLFVTLIDFESLMTSVIS